MKIILTGASSFTGFWFADALIKNGHDVLAACTQEQGTYQGLKKRRLDLLAGRCSLEYACSFGSPKFLDLINASGGISCLAHHGAQVSDYKNFNFSPIAALSENTYNLLPTLHALKDASCTTVILTGSIFEYREGLSSSARAFSPYGLSKGLTSEVFRFYCHALDLTLGKFVIPNPFGPLENTTFVTYLMQQWLNDKTALVKTPAYIRDNIHVSLLARSYTWFVEKTTGQTGYHTFHPSGYISSQGDFAERLAMAMRGRLRRSCLLEHKHQPTFAEPHIRINSDPVAPLFPDWHEDAAYDALLAYYHPLSEKVHAL